MHPRICLHIQMHLFKIEGNQRTDCWCEIGALVLHVLFTLRNCFHTANIAALRLYVLVGFRQVTNVSSV